MRILYLDCAMGAAGDMLAAALLELVPDPDAFVAELNGLGIPGVRFRRERAVKCGIAGTHLAVEVDGVEEESHDVHGHEHGHEHGHDHTHEHGHGHHHSHSGMEDIEHIVRDHLALPEGVKDHVMAVYGLIAQAESHAHGVPVEEIHFHEVGAMDAVADITAVCLLMDRLAPDHRPHPPGRAHLRRADPGGAVHPHRGRPAEALCLPVRPHAPHAAAGPGLRLREKGL